MSAWACRESHCACWLYLGIVPGSCPEIPKRTCCCCHSFHIVSSAPQPLFPNFTVNSHSVLIITACTLYWLLLLVLFVLLCLCTGDAWIHHSKNSPHFPEPTVQLLLAVSIVCSSKGGLMFALVFFFFLSYLNTSTSVFLVTVCGFTCTSSSVFIQILSSYTRFKSWIFLELSRKPGVMQEYPILFS